MAAAVGGNDLLANDPAVLHVVELELLRVSEMLEDLSVFIAYCDSHYIRSFPHELHFALIVEAVAAAPDQKPLSVYKSLRDFSAGALVNRRHGGAGDAHPLGALLLGHPLPVKKPNCLKFIQAHDDRLAVRHFRGRELPMIRVPANPSAALFSGHRRASFSDLCQ